MSHPANWRRRVAEEFEGTVSQVINGLKGDGYSLAASASILGVSPHTLKRECERNGIEFARYQQSPGRKKHQQVNLPPNARMLDLDGEILHLGEWSRRVGIQRWTILYRLDVMKLSVREALTRPVCSHNHALPS